MKCYLNMHLDNNCCHLLFKPLFERNSFVILTIKEQKRKIPINFHYLSTISTVKTFMDFANQRLKSD